MKNKSKIIVIALFIIILLIVVALLIIRNMNIKVTTMEPKIVYGYCPNNSYIDIDTVFIKSSDELKEKLISQLEKAKEELEQEKQEDPKGYEFVEIKDNVIYVNEKWEIENNEWENSNDELKNNITIEEYFNDEFFKNNNLLVYSYSLYNGSKEVDEVQVEKDTAYIKFKSSSVNGGPYDYSVGYCFVIFDKSISQYRIIDADL